jgi:hypothetical protein
VKLHVDREICMRREQRTQMYDKRALALPKQQHKKRTDINVRRALAPPTACVAAAASAAAASAADTRTDSAAAAAVAAVQSTTAQRARASASASASL